jgi:predicted RNase H-like nuclease (RuvC/YqgF family)
VCGGQAEQLQREKEELELAVEQTRREFESKAQALDREREEEGPTTRKQEKRKQLEQELRQKTAQKLAEFDQLKTSLQRDLQNRCETVNRTCTHATRDTHATTHATHAKKGLTRNTPHAAGDLEMLLDEARACRSL